MGFLFLISSSLQAVPHPPVLQKLLYILCAVRLEVLGKQGGLPILLSFTSIQPSEVIALQEMLVAPNHIIFILSILYLLWSLLLDQLRLLHLDVLLLYDHMCFYYDFLSNHYTHMSNSRCQHSSIYCSWSCWLVHQLYCNNPSLQGKALPPLVLPVGGGMVFEVELARHNCNSSFLIFLSFTAELTDRAENAVALSSTPSFAAVTICVGQKY